MKPTFQEFEKAFPGKGQEIMDLLEKRTLTTSYGSVLRMCDKYHDTPPLYHQKFMVAIVEIVGADNLSWSQSNRSHGFSKGACRVTWSYERNIIMLSKRGD